jgi:PEGA domain
MVRAMLRCGWLLLLVSSATWAQTPRALFDEGTALYSKGQFAEAAVKFEASFAARPVPVTKFNIARAWEQAGETLKAIDAWQAWLVMSPTAAERPAAEASLKALGDKLAKLGVQALSISSLPLGARVSVDGTAVGVVPITVELTPTRHLIRLDAEGRVPMERTVVVQLDRPTVQLFELAPLEDAALPVPVVSTRPAPLPAPTIPRATDFASSLSNDTVQVHIVSDEKELRLYRANGNPNGECRAPCDAPVARATDTFMISGAGIVPSNAFVLIDHAHGGRVSMKVKAGSAAGFYIGGTLLTTAAIAGLIIGFVFIGKDATAGGIGLGFGTAAAVGGILSFVLNGTTVTFAGE